MLHVISGASLDGFKLNNLSVLKATDGPKACSPDSFYIGQSVRSHILNVSDQY